MEDFIEQCKLSYHAGDPMISDEQFDTLVEKYGEEGVGHSTGDSAVPHLFRMYSLKKFYDGEEQPPIVNGSKISTYKLDGAAVDLLYSGGTLVRALTRGDGFRGEDITDKVLEMEDVPAHIINQGVFQITGEVVASKDIPNSRNYASGALNLKSIEEFKERSVYFYAYGIACDDEGLGTYETDMKSLKAAGFNTVLDLPVNKPIPYPNDGIVVRINSNAIYHDMGFTSKHPRGAWALKERSEGIETTLTSVIWQVGKSGKVTPVAILDPVEIDGAVVQRATLNNIGFIKGLELSIGDKVLVERAGGIIPRIISKAG